MAHGSRESKTGMASLETMPVGMPRLPGACLFLGRPAPLQTAPNNRTQARERGAKEQKGRGFGHGIEAPLAGERNPRLTDVTISKEQIDNVVTGAERRQRRCR